MEGKILRIGAVAFIIGAVVAGASLLAGCKKKVEGSAQTGTQTVVKAATCGMPKPFSYVNERNELVGHNIELIKAVFERLPQYKLEIEITDFPSLFSGMDAGRYQIGINNFAMNEDRKEKYLFSDPMFVNVHVAAVPESNTSYGDRIDSFSVFAGKTSQRTVGVTVTMALENYNRAHPEAQTILRYTDAEMLVILQDVEQGKVDFEILDKPMFEYYMQQFPLKLKAVELSEEVEYSISQQLFSYMLVAKGNDQLVVDINKGLREVIADGTSKRINEKYFGEDFSPSLN
jgi:polar amino acid transport system substrate-binding protein